MPIFQYAIGDFKNVLKEYVMSGLRAGIVPAVSFNAH